MYTQLNQYHVVLEVDPQYRDDPDALKISTSPATTGQVPLSAISHFETGTVVVAESSGAVPGRHRLV